MCILIVYIVGFVRFPLSFLMFASYYVLFQRYDIKKSIKEIIGVRQLVITAFWFDVCTVQRIAMCI